MIIMVFAWHAPHSSNDRGTGRALTEISSSIATCVACIIKNVILEVASFRVIRCQTQ